MTAAERAQNLAPGLDRQVLQVLQEALEDVSGEFVGSLAAVYEVQAAELMTELDQAAQELDGQRLALAAHSLKGSSANVGGNRLAALCEELEYWDGESHELPSKVAAIRQELDLLLVELSVFVTR